MIASGLSETRSNYLRNLVRLVGEFATVIDRRYSRLRWLRMTAVGVGTLLHSPFAIRHLNLPRHGRTRH